MTRGVASIVAGQADRLYLGNLEAKRDWGYAPEYVEAMWQMLQLDEPDDFVIATGETHSVQDFVAEAFDLVDLIGSATSRSILAICARMRSTRCAGTPPRLGKSSAGSRGRHSTSS